jgi:hypothetical protein
MFPPDFFADEVKEKYKKYYRSLVLPYDTIEDFMSSTIQQIDFPGWDMELKEQTRTRGKRQEYKSAKPVEDLFKRQFTLTFKLSDAFLNYFIFLDNALNFVDHANKKQSASPMQLALLSNQGYLVSSVVFNDPILFGQDGIKMSYSATTPEFKTFTAKFNYLDFDLDIKFD